LDEEGKTGTAMVAAVQPADGPSTSYLLLLLLLLLPNTLPISQCFSIDNSRIRSKHILDQFKFGILDTSNEDATSVPLQQLLNLTYEPYGPFAKQERDSPPLTLLFASDFVPKQEISLIEYDKFTRSRHNDSIILFDGYTTENVRCEAMDETRLNVRWRASWIPAGSTWLYNLADSAGWIVEKRSPDSTKVATFSWRSVFGLFSQALLTGTITLPISSVEGNTVIAIDESSDMKICRVSIKESVDLVSEADRDRLQNRRVAQELASWLDVSRRPDECGISAEEWADTVRSRILAGVPGAGTLDVDPNEDDAEGRVALLWFGAICLASLALSFEYFVVPEIVGGSGTISEKCDDAARIEFGSGYLSECFGPYGDGPFVR